MELIYLYVQKIDETNRLKKAAFPFSPNFRFVHVDKARSFSLHITQNTVVPHNFFPKHISNVSFLVGQNGSGKTTALELLRYLLSLKDERPSGNGGQARFLVIFKQESGEFKVFSSLDHSSTQGPKHKKVECLYEGQVLPVQELLEEGWLFHRTWGLKKVPIDYPATATVSYSPLFNLRDYPGSFDNPGYIDITSNFLVQVDKREERIEDPLLAHRRADVRRSLNFIIRALHDRGRWNRHFMQRFIPEQLAIAVHTKVLSDGGREMRYMGMDAMAIYDVLKRHYVNYRVSLVMTYREERRSRNAQKIARTLFRLEMLVAAIDGLYNVIEHRGSGFTSPNDFMFDLFNGGIEIQADSKEEPFIEFLRRQKAIPQKNITEWLGLLDRVQEEVDLVDDGDVTFKISVRMGQNVLWLDSLLRLVPKKFTDEYQPLMSFDWADMSSGQKMMLDMFSRLYYAHNLIASSSSRYGSVCLLLDEPEVGFHPQWQREWFRELLIFTKGLVADRFNRGRTAGMKYQLIVATNNPMSLSDVPGPCVQYIGPHSDAPQTFAANIHELLGDSFYLQNGFIGQFAKDKLESLIRFLATSKARRTRAWNDLSAWQVIKLVGDEVIKQRLTDLYYMKYPEQLPTSATEIELLEARLRGLKAGQAQ